MENRGESWKSVENHGKLKKIIVMAALVWLLFVWEKFPESLKEMSTHDKNSNIVALVRKKTNYYE